MSKTVKIPDNMHPFRCEINGVEYGPWPAGSVQTVPDEVAALIGAIDAASPGEDPKAEKSFEDQVRDIVDPMVVYLEYDSEESNYTADKTSAEILDVLESGRRVVIEFTIPAYEGWTYRADVSVSGTAGIEETRYAGLFAQMVNPLTSELVTIFQNPVSGTDDNTTWAMEAYSI